MHFAGGAQLRRKHGDGLSQVLYILRAERSSAPTDLRRMFRHCRCVRCGRSAELHRKHGDGLSQVLCILRAEQGGMNKSPPPLQTCVVSFKLYLSKFLNIPKKASISR